MIKPPFDVRPGTLHKTKNYGTLIVKEYVSRKNVVVQFVKTGFITPSRSNYVREGVVRDMLHPIVYGVGFTGVGCYSASRDKKVYKTWCGMLERCYSEKSLKKRPTYVGCSVASEWHNFQNFTAWFYENYPTDNKVYDLDKDIKVSGNKVYCPDACLFVSHEDNVVKASAKHYTFNSPDGETVDVYNLNGFCRLNNLNHGHMGAVNSGKRNHHKGWTKV